MKMNWRTAWQGEDIVVFRDEEIVDRIHGPDIERVVFVYRGGGESPGDPAFAVVEMADEHVIFPAETGFSGRVHFERQAFWSARACVYWVSERKATLPSRLRPGLWFIRRARASFVRLPRAELASLLAEWPLEGPQTWEERKERRIEMSRPFADLGIAALPYNVKQRRA